MLHDDFTYLTMVVSNSILNQKNKHTMNLLYIYLEYTQYSMNKYNQLTACSNNVN